MRARNLVRVVRQVGLTFNDGYLTSKMMTSVTRRQFCKMSAAALFALRSRESAAAPFGNPPTERSFQKLASQISGRIITPQTADYDSARMVFNRAFDRHPALIVQCAAAADVALALEFAADGGLPIAVRGGGHSRAGFSTCDAGVVIDLSRMNGIEIDAESRVARVGAGAIVAQVDAATQRVGLATTLAGCPTVGVAGLTLGGGEGFLMSKFGATCDNLISANLVTADGRFIEASQSSHSDLFWAIRGGGGNFGVVTELRYRLHPLSEVLAGTLVFPPGEITERLGTFARFVHTAPDEMNVVGQVVATDKGPQFKMLVCHCGDLHLGDNLLAPWRGISPVVDTIRAAPYLEINATINPATPAAHFQTNLFLPQLSARAIATIASSTLDAPSNTRVFIVPIYGAITRVGVNETAFPLRLRGFEIDIMGRWDDSNSRSRAIEWVSHLRNALKPFARGAYVNQLGETSESLVREAYATNYARLVSIKKKYDPSNLFRSNQNIRPV